ncbi:MAG: class I SAM-dependent methyltransferase [Magnetococcales bacterium]|nr:class I SAM-dependent methyltransferase [Magnetococcales bacterium]
MKQWMLQFISHERLPPPHDIIVEKQKDGEIIDGRIVSVSAPDTTPVTIRMGVPILADDSVIDSDTAKSFGFEWGSHLEGKIEDESRFGYSLEQEIDYFLTATKESRESLAGKMVLDGGCGPASLTAGIAKLGPQHMVGIDINTATFEAYHHQYEQKNLGLFLCNILDPQLQPESFDLVWSSGVIHHTPDPKAGFDALAKCVKPEGKMYIWVYGTHFSPIVAMRDILEIFGLRSWSNGVVMNLCRLFAALTLPAVWLVQLLAFCLPPFANIATVKNICERWGKKGALRMIWFDVLSPKYRYKYSRATLKQWFTEAGFEIIGEYDYQTGILGQKRKG